jgi:hypothetical protein
MMAIRFNSLSLAVFFVISTVMLIADANAEQKKTLGPWDVHYIVVNSTFFEPEVARQYGIQRSQFNALLNISVLDKDSKSAQSVALTGKATNLIGTTKKLSFKEVREGEAIYYLAQIPFRHKENYRFEVDVRRGNEVEKLTFKHEFYVE